MFIACGDVNTLAIVHIYHVLFISEYHPPGLFRYFDVVWIYLLLSFIVQILLYLTKLVH